MSNAFVGLEPALLWKHFEALTSTPRPSKKEEKVVALVRAWAQAKGFVFESDEAGNALVRVPATPGCEAIPALALQGHLDMVAEKNKDKVFDFDTQGLQVVRDGDLLKADGTTLGADNGIGVAMAMALCEEKDLRHGPLELIFTIDEETGLTGARNLQPGFLKAKRLINIDSEEEGVLFVGCAGGAESNIVFGRPTRRCSAPVYAVKVSGLNGGHSGLTIHENRGNALKALAQLLLTMGATQPVSIIKFEGGDKHNAIPREAFALIRSAASPADLKASLEHFRASFAQEYGKAEPRASFECLPSDSADGGLSGDDSATFLRLLLAIPHGVVTMSRDIPGLVESSSNLAAISSEGGSFRILLSSRSSVASAVERVLLNIEAIATLAGAAYIFKGSYPGWQPDMDSTLLVQCKAAWKELSGKDPHVTAIHAGLECGIIGSKYPGMDMISMGPNMWNVHSPDEKLSISSSARVYDYLKRTVASLAR
jgi:dipeptidase D